MSIDCWNAWYTSHLTKKSLAISVCLQCIALLQTPFKVADVEWQPFRDSGLHWVNYCMISKLPLDSLGQLCIEGRCHSTLHQLDTLFVARHENPNVISMLYHCHFWHRPLLYWYFIIDRRHQKVDTVQQSGGSSHDLHKKDKNPISARLRSTGEAIETSK